MRYSEAMQQTKDESASKLTTRRKLLRLECMSTSRYSRKTFLWMEKAARGSKISVSALVRRSMDALCAAKTKN